MVINMNIASNCPLLEFSEALKDSPAFRMSIRQHESSLSLFETKSCEFIKLCNIMVESGKTYMASFQSFLYGLAKLNDSCFNSDEPMHSAVTKIYSVLEELLKYQKVFVEQAQWSICRNLNDFIKREMQKVQETRVHFERLSDSLDDAFGRLASVPRNKEAEAVESRNELTAVGTCFAHTALDYAFLINSLQCRRRQELIEVMLQFVLACQTYFHEGFDLFSHWEDTKTDISDLALKLRQQCKSVDKQMQDRHTLVPKEIFQQPIQPTNSNLVAEGYLFKRAKKGFKHWKRRWFIIRDCKILYRKREPDFPVVVNAMDTEGHAGNAWTSGFSELESDLRICLVRPAPNATDRRNSFELVTPTKTHIFQADSKAICDAWIRDLQRTIVSAIQRKTSVQKETSICFALPSSRGVLDAIINSVPGNQKCVDCGAANPEWASVNLGVTLCIACCGIHRGMSIQVSKTRSLTMDSWERCQVGLMQKLGNDFVNSVFLAARDHYELVFPPPAKPSSLTVIRESWIRAKYVERRFMKPLITSTLNRSPSDRFSSLKDPIPSFKKRRRATVLGEEQLTDDNDNSICESAPLATQAKCRSYSCSDLHRCLLYPASCRAAARGSTAVASTVSYVPESCDFHLLSASERGNVREMLKAVAMGANVNCVDLRHEGRTPLHQSVLSKSTEACEYLLLNGAQINAQDAQGNTALHLAVKAGLTGIVCQFLKRGANYRVPDGKGFTPLDTAVNAEGDVNADIITLLRVSRFHQEQNEDPDTIPGNDSLFDAVMSEFSLMDPRKLSRQQEPVGENLAANGATTYLKL